MQPLASAAQMKELDRTAIERCGVSSLDLMEHAAQAVAGQVQLLLQEQEPHIIGGACSVGVIGTVETQEQQQELDDIRQILESQFHNDVPPRVGVLCGPGNNGGDGIAAARLLRGMGFQVRALLVGDPATMTEDARTMQARLCDAGGALERFDPQDRRTMAWLSTCSCMVDALLGVGLNRPLEGDYLLAVRLMAGRPVVSCDIPSGLDADTGAVLGAAVRATVTVTFTRAKLGHYLGEGPEYTGTLCVAEIGIPHALLSPRDHKELWQVCTVDPSDVRLPRRRRAAHKGDFGRVWMLAGSVGYTGAPVLAASAAVRTGSGLVSLGVPPDVWPVVAARCLEAMPAPLPPRYEDLLRLAEPCDAVLLGPGLGRAPEAQTLVRQLLADLRCPVVLDADGINALAGHIDILDGRTAPTVLTPHMGEFARLTGTPLPQSTPLQAARDFAMAHRCVLVLKGHRTITAAPDGSARINTSGNPGMAKGGSGDVLAGVILSLLGQGLNPLRAAITGVWLHGDAGDRCAQTHGEYGMTPGDLVQALPQVIQDIVQDETRHHFRR